MAGKNQYTAQDFIDEIPGTGGVITHIAKRVGCSWNTAKKYIDEYVTVKRVFEAEKSSVDDDARSVVIEAIQEKRDLETAKWWLRMKLSDEFGTSHDITSGGETIKVTLTDD